MAKPKYQTSTAAETKIVSNTPEIQWEQLDLKQFPKGLKAELMANAPKSVTSCASRDPKVLDKVVRTLLRETSPLGTQSTQAEKTPKPAHSSKRIMKQAAATAHTR